MRRGFLGDGLGFPRMHLATRFIKYKVMGCTLYSTSLVRERDYDLKNNLRCLNVFDH